MPSIFVVIVADLISRPQSNTTFMHTANLSLILHVDSGTIYIVAPHVRRPPMISFFFVTKLKELNQLYLDLDECRCNLC